MAHVLRRLLLVNLPRVIFNERIRDDCKYWQVSNERTMYKSDDHIEYALNLPMAYNSGELWAYNSASLWLVGEIISKESNMSVPEFAKQYLFEPLGITDFQWWLSPRGRAMLAGNAEMRPIDMAKFGRKL